jgi:hypothetical protein
MLDTAGRTHIDEPLMAEVAVREGANPHETLLVADALTGQDAVNLAENFDERIGITGLVLTRMDGDGRGGAALSMRAVTGKPIKLIGTGEKMDALEDFHPSASPTASSAWATSSRWSRRPPKPSTPKRPRRWPSPLAEGQVRPERPRRPARQMQKMGGMGGMMGMMPGMGKMKKQMDGGRLDDKIIRPPDRHHQLDDQEGARQSRILKHRARSASPPVPAPGRRRHQQASEDAPPDGRHDESHEGQEGRRHDGQDDGRPTSSEARRSAQGIAPLDRQFRRDR